MTPDQWVAAAAIPAIIITLCAWYAHKVREED